MKPALNHDLRAARRTRLPDFLQNRIIAEEVCPRLVRILIKGAKLTRALADIRVIDISIDDKRHAVTESLCPLRIGRLAERDEITVR